MGFKSLSAPAALPNPLWIYGSRNFCSGFLGPVWDKVSSDRVRIGQEFSLNPRSDIFN